MAGNDQPTQAQLDYLESLRVQTADESDPVLDTREEVTAEITRLRGILNDQRRAARIAAEKGREARDRKEIAEDAASGVVNASGFHDDETERDQGGRYSTNGLGDYEPESVTEGQEKYLKALCNTHGVKFADPGSIGAASEMIDQLQERTDQNKFQERFMGLGPGGRAAVMEVLSEREASVLEGLYVRGLNPNQVAGELGIAKRSVDLRDQIARHKVGRLLQSDFLDRAQARSQQQSL